MGVLAEAMENSDSIFDLLIFDEAHKTAGSKDKTFAIGLNNDLIPSQKRLFVTATPRHYDLRQRDSNHEQTLIYSMDDPIKYGPRAYTLTFREAINLGIICDYKVIIPVFIKKHYVTKKDELIEKAMGLEKAIESQNITKLITFHHSINEAKQFTEYLTSKKILSGFENYTVNSTMLASERTEKMLRFKEASKAIMSNARCLTGGTNIPAIDMVFFKQEEK
jgi:predicted helicase